VGICSGLNDLTQPRWRAQLSAEADARIHTASQKPTGIQDDEDSMDSSGEDAPTNQQTSNLTSSSAATKLKKCENKIGQSTKKVNLKISEDSACASAIAD